MTGILLAAIKVAYLVLMWVFIGFVALTIRGDLVGRTMSKGSLLTGGAAARGADQSTPAPGDPQNEPKRSRRRHRKQLSHLSVVTGAQTGTKITLPERLILGRATDSGFNIDDDYASSHHASLYRQSDGRWVVDDLQSTNGTYVNGERITGPTLVGADDVIRIGRTQLELER